MREVWMWVWVHAGLVVRKEFDRLFGGVTVEGSAGDALPDTISRDIRSKRGEMV